MKNEATIWFDNDESYIYFKTNKKTAKQAYREFEYLMERVGVDTSNLIVSEIDLHDANTFKEIEIYKP